MISVSNYLVDILVPKVFLYDKTQGKAFKMTTLGRDGLFLWCNADIIKVVIDTIGKCKV